MTTSKHPALRRSLGFRDVIMMMVIAVVNINTIPLLAKSGWISIPLWILAGFTFLLPIGLAVAVFGQRYPQEGGIYVWTKELFGDFHAFISGWCYWTNNLFYFPSILFILVGVLVYTGGANAEELGKNQFIQAAGAIFFLWLITLLHVRGLGTGKWMNNIGAFGTYVGLVLLFVVAFILLSKSGTSATTLNTATLKNSLFTGTSLSTFSLMLYSLVGIELAPVMGEEIQNMRGVIKRASFVASTVCVFLYVVGTASLLVAIPASEISPVQGVMQAIQRSFTAVGIESFVPVVSVIAALALIGVASAWISGAARIPFVMGVTAYLPPSLGRIHPRFGTPHVALISQAVVSTLLICVSLMGSTVNEAYSVMLSSSVVIQLIPFVYLFIGLYKIGKYKILSILAAFVSLVGIFFVFIPSEIIQNVFAYEVKLVVFPALILATAALIYRNKKSK